MYADFDLHLPKDLTAALAILADAGDEASMLPLAGGTNLIVDLRARSVAPAALVGIGDIPDMRGIDAANGEITMGGKTTVSDILRSPDMPRCGSSLFESARVFAGQMVRNTATVAGNICYGSPAADLVPPLLVLDAKATLEGREGARTLPLSEFFLDYKRTVRRPDELLTRITWPTPSSDSVDLFYKLARRKGDAITMVGVAVALDIDDGKCARARIALGAVAPVVMRALEAERMLQGETLTPDLIEAAARQAAEAASPIDDVRASGEYRRHSVHVLTRRLLTQAWQCLSERGQRQ
jgi:carbon-monoxide dehydrogenase medium subunit